MNPRPTLKYFQYILWYILVCAVTICGSSDKDESNWNSLQDIRNDLVKLLDKNSEESGTDYESMVLRNKRQYGDEKISSLWHSYRFGTGTGNREVLKVSGVHKENWLGQGCNGYGVWSWQSIEIGRNRGLLLGLGLDSLTLCSYSASYHGSEMNNGQPAYSAMEYNLKVSGLPTAAEMFQTWNDTSKMTDVIIVLALNFNDRKPILVWYRVINNEKPILLKLPNTWDLHKSVWNLQSLKINLDRKLLVLNHPEDERKDTSIDLYGFIWEKEGTMDFWLVQKIDVHAASSVAIINVGETVFLGISLPNEGVINIYSFDHIDNKFKRFQEIEAEGVSKLISFYVGFSSFVAVAGKEPMLLRYDKEEFVTEKIDGIEELGPVLHWLPIPIHTYRDEVVLLVETEEDNEQRLISVVTWIGGHPGFSLKEPPTCYMDGLVEQGLRCLSDPVVDIDVKFGLELAAALSLGRWNPSLIVPRSNGPSVLFRLEAYLESVQSPVEKEMALLKDKEKELNDIISEQFSIIKNARAVLEEVLDQNDKNVITGSWYIPLLEASKVVVSEIGSDSGLQFMDDDDTNYWKFGGLNWKVEEVPSVGIEGINSLKSLVKDLTSSIEDIKSEVEDAVPLAWDGDEPVIITAPQAFKGAISIEGKLLANNFHLDKLDGVKVKEILTNTVRLDKKKKITGHKVIKTLSADNLKILDKLGAVDVSSLVFADDEHVVLDGLEYENELKVYGDVFLPEGGTVNGFDLSEDIVAVNGTYDFGIKFVNGIFAEDVHTDSINELHINEEYFSSIMRENDNKMDKQIVESTLIMSYLEADGEKVKIENINGKNFKDMLSKLVFVNEGGYIPGKTYAKECHALEDTDILSLNDVRFPEEFVVTYKDKQVITGKKSFSSGKIRGSLQTSYLELSGLVNGINTSNFITLSMDQDLKNTSFHFTDVEMDDLQVLENVNDVPIENYKSPPVLGETNEIQSDVYFQDVEVKGDIIVKGSIDEKQWEDLLGGIIYDDAENVIIKSSKLEIQDLEVQSLSLKGLINGLDVSGFLTKDTEQTFVGKKSIGGNTVFKTIEVEDGLVGGVNIRYLAENAVRLSGQVVGSDEPDPKSEAQKIDGFVIFEDEIFISSLLGTTINDFSPDKVAFINRDQEFIGVVEFETLEVDNMYVDGSFQPKKTISGINLQEFDEKRFSLTKAQEIEDGVEVYIHDAVIDGDLNINSINNVILNELNVSALITAETAPDINYHIETMIVKGVISTNGIGMYNLQDIRENAIWINKDNFIEGEIIFMDEINFDSLSVTGTVNGYDLDAFLKDVVIKGEKVVVSGPKTFVTGLKVGDIITSFLNGKKTEEILTTNTYQEINEPFRIKGDVMVGGKLKVENGKVNGIELSDFADQYEWKDGIHVLKGDVILNGSTTINSLHVFGLVSGVNWKEFLEAATFINDHVEFTGNITFSNKVVFNDDLDVVKTIDGIDMDALFGPRGSAVLFGDKGSSPNRFSYSTVDGLVRFKDDVVVNNVFHVYGDMTADRLYGCDLGEWAEEAIFLDRSNYIQGTKIFNTMRAETDIEVGFINDVDFNKIILLNKDQEFEKQLNFKSLSIPSDKDVHVGISVNGFNLMEEYKNTLLVEGDQMVYGKKTFTNTVEVKGDVLTNGTINYVSTNKIVTLHTEQNITGLIEADHIVANQDVRILGLVNEKYFNQWVDLGVCKDGSRSTISGTWTVKGNVTFLGDVLGEGALDGVDVSELHDLSSLESDTHQRAFMETKENLDILCEKLKYLEERTINQPFLFKGLEAVQKIKPKHDIQSMYSFNAFDNTYLAVTYTTVCGGELYMWDSTETSFVFAGFLNFAGGSKWHYLGNTEDYAILVVASKDDERECEHPSYNVWHFDPQLFQFEHVQSIGDFKSSKVLMENSSEPNLFYTLEDDGVYKWVLNEDGNLQKSQYLDQIEYLNLRQENDCDTGVVHEDNETKIINNGNMKKTFVVRGLDDYVILSISENLLLGAYIEYENAVIKGITDYVKVYDLNDGSLFTKIPSFNPTSLIALDFGYKRQKMLAFLENYRNLKIYEYKGVEGFIEHLSFPVKFSQLISVSLRVRSLFSPHNFILALYETQVIVFEAEMLGDPISEVPSLECPIL